MATQIEKMQQVIVESVSKSIRDAVVECLIKRVDQYGDLVDWRVKGEDASAYFPTRDQAVAFIVKVMVDEAVRKALREAGMSVPSSITTPLDEDGTGLDHTGNKKPTLMQQHRAKGGAMIDGVRYPATKGERQPRIL